MMKMIKNLFFFICILFAVSIPFARADCWEYAEKSFGIEAKLLNAIAIVESGMNPVAVGKNNNGSYDYGLMQINSIHLGWLKKIGINKEELKRDPCTSVLVGASILADMMKVYGYGWEAVGAYNAGLAKDRHRLRMKYAKKVWCVYHNGEGPEC